MIMVFRTGAISSYFFAQIIGVPHFDFRVLEGSGGSGADLYALVQKNHFTEDVSRPQGAQHDVRSIRLPEDFYIPVENNVDGDTIIPLLDDLFPLLVLENR
ncbi:MAG: hypothetical protein MZV70_11325 [Desulfobacterales bacterium]|nr:hypothetical protein [Desulfobacterales bacterium]